MAGRNTRQRETPDNKTRRGEEGRNSEGKEREYELQIKRVTQMEMNIEENSKRWKEMVQEMKEVKALLRDGIDKKTEGDKDPGWMFERVEQMSMQVTELSETIDGLRKTNDGLMEQNKALKQRVEVIGEENEALRDRLISSEERGKEQGENLVKLKQGRLGEGS